MASPATRKWHPLTSVPTDDANFDHEFQFHIVCDHQTKALYAIHSINGLLKYSFKSNTWKQHHLIRNELPDTFFDDKMPSAINRKQTIYLYNFSEESLAILPASNSTSREWKIVHRFNSGLFGSAPAIIINDELHIIGLWYYGYKHAKYNKDTQQLEILHDLEFGFSGLVKMEHKLLSFGGWKGSGYLDDIHEYDIINAKWSKYKIKLPTKLMIDGITSIFNGQFIALFGGFSGKKVKSIWIYSVKNKTFKEAKVQCPSDRGGDVLAVNNPKQDELSVFGYVRGQWSECGIDNHLFPPRYLIKIMSRYYMNEWVHLIDHHGDHWKIDVFDLFGLK